MSQRLLVMILPLMKFQGLNFAEPKSSFFTFLFFLLAPFENKFQGTDIFFSKGKKP